MAHLPSQRLDPSRVLAVLAGGADVFGQQVFEPRQSFSADRVHAHHLRSDGRLADPLRERYGRLFPPLFARLADLSTIARIRCRVLPVVKDLSGNDVEDLSSEDPP